MVRLNRLMRLPTFFGCVALICLAAVGMAVGAQHVLGHEPCPWCILQRVVFVAMAIVAIVALVATQLRRTFAQRLVLMALIVLAGCGMAAALWQHFVAAATQTCNLTLADKIIHALLLDTYLPELFEPRASCADAKFYFLGLPYEMWSLGLYALMALGSVRVMWVGLRQGRD